MANALPKVETTYFPLHGGLDLVTPSISVPPGTALDAQNYEPEISGGYRRIDGYERFDGHPSPTSAGYWTFACAVTGVAVGATLTGNTSHATCRVLALLTGAVVAGRLSGVFLAGETLKVGGVAVGTATAPPILSGASSSSDHADYTLLAANDFRADILAVPGSGPIRGVQVYNGHVYAFRDNAGKTASIMWVATAGGWSQIAFGSEVQFNAATGQINVGDTVTGASSGASGVVVAKLLMTGTWTSAGVGSLVFATISGAPFTLGEALRVGGVGKATAAAASVAIVRLPGGRLDFTNYNFTSSSTGGLKMYGADSVNLVFEFDDTTYVPIHTGMGVDTPVHLMGYWNFLVLSFLGSVQLSGIGAPYAWTTVLGAAEIATGDPVTGFLPAAGTATSSALAIFTAGRTHVLYGKDQTSFQDVPSIWEIGMQPFTMQPVSNNVYGLTARGIQAMITTLTYGDFDYSSVSHLVQPIITAKQGTAAASCALRQRNQYRLFYTDGTALAVGLTGDSINGILPLFYKNAPTCYCNTTPAGGQEVSYFGTAEGYVMQDNIGTSQDGQTLEAWLRLPFNHVKSPRVRKRWRRAVMDVKCDAYSQVNVTYDLGYASSNVLPSPWKPNIELTGSGGYWDNFIWDKFVWDAQVVADPSISLEGTEKNIALLFYSDRAQDGSHTLQGITMHFTPRRNER